MRSKKIVKFLVFIAFSTGILSSCSGPYDSLPQNEVLTTIPYDPLKETLVISASDGLDCVKAKADLEAKFSDINIVFRRGKSIESSVLGNTADIYLPLSSTLAPEVEEQLLDLSAFESTSNYYMTALNGCASINDNKQYLLPMAGNIRGIIYNKTLFEENGWVTPKSKSEFVDLCHTIDKSGVVERAFQPSLYYQGEVLNFGEFFQMSNFFDTLEYFSWAEKYSKYGLGSAEFVLPKLLDSFNYFLDNNVIKKSDFSILPSQRSKMMYVDRTAAMTIETQNASLYASEYESKDEFAMFPFFSGDKAGDDYVLSIPIAYLGVNINVTKKGNEKKMKLVKEFLDFIATKEGQDVFVPKGNAGITQIKNAEMASGNEVMLHDVKGTIDEGRMVPPRLFFKSDINLTRSAVFDVITGMLETERGNNNIIQEDRAVTLKEAIDYIDSINQKAIYKAVSTVEKVYAKASKSFTVLETTQYLAQMLKDKTGTDIALYLSNTLSRGNNLAIQEGDLVKKSGGIYPYDFVDSMDCIGRTQSTGDDRKIVTLKMSGEQIIKAIEVPMPTGDSEMFEPFFVTAGLKIEFAPWNKKGSRYLKISLADGSELKLDKEYTVSAWNFTIDPLYINERTGIYEYDFQDLFRAQLIKDKTISPFTDGRFKLNRNVSK